jgi:hypothetical protein
MKSLGVFLKFGLIPFLVFLGEHFEFVLQFVRGTAPPDTELFGHFVHLQVGKLVGDFFADGVAIQDVGRPWLLGRIGVFLGLEAPLDHVLVNEIPLDFLDPGRAVKVIAYMLNQVKVAVNTHLGTAARVIVVGDSRHDSFALFLLGYRFAYVVVVGAPRYQDELDAPTPLREPSCS